MAEGGSEGVSCRCLFPHDRSMGQVDNVRRYYLKGECIYGSRCRYDHIRTKPRTDGGGRPPRGGRAAGHNHRSQNHSSSAEGGNHSGNHVATSGSLSTPSRTPLTGGAPRAQKSNASIVRPEGGGEKALPSKDASSPLCPYELASGNCPMGDRCSYVHGQLCDLCQKPCLHPFNEDQRAQHREECVQPHEQDMALSVAVQRSAGKACGICLEIVMDKEPASERRFGILEKCSHVFCIKCIRMWRGNRQSVRKSVRSCPECRTKSDFVMPSSFWVDMGTEKDRLIADYKSAMSEKPCRYFQEGRGKCPFAAACFYKHTYPNGREAVMPPPRRRWNHNGELGIKTQLQRLYLWDILDVAVPHMLAAFNLEDVFEILSETEESDSD